MASYQYVLRTERYDEVLNVEHDGHKVGDRVELKGTIWIVDAMVKIRRWETVERVILRPAADEAEDRSRP